MDNKEKNLPIGDDGAEFEIPDVTVFEGYSEVKNANEAQKSAKPRKKRTPKKPAEDLAQISFDVFDTATEPSSNEGKRKKTGKHPLPDNAEGTAHDESVVAAEDSSDGSVNEISTVNETSDTVIDEIDATTAADEADNKPDTNTTAADTEGEEITARTDPDDAAPIAIDLIETLRTDTEPTDKSGAYGTLDEDAREAQAASEDESNATTDEDIDGNQAENEASADDDTAGAAIFETDADGRRIIPDDYFPDDALSYGTPEPTENIEVIDLLGDPISEPSDVIQTEQVCEVVEEIVEVTEQEYEHPDPTVAPEAAYDPEHPRRIDAIFDFIELLIFTLVSVLVITSFFVKHAVVDGKSMQNTLQHGDVLIISDLFYEPAPGDVIVFEDYSLEKEAYRKPLVKRVIAVEGQRVTVKRDGIYVDYDDNADGPLYEPYVYTSDPDYEYRIVKVCDEISSLDTFGFNDEGYWFIVPEGEVFALGDHRDDSTDSRDLGTIRVDAILGKVLFRVFPFDDIGAINDITD